MIYSGKEKKVYYNGEEYDFDCGVCLNEYSAIFASILCGQRTVQQAYDCFVKERLQIPLTADDVKSAIRESLDQALESGLLLPAGGEGDDV